MLNNIYSRIIGIVERCEDLSFEDACAVLDVDQLDTFELLGIAYQARRQHFGKIVMIHVLNNVQNGLCSEDCRYCAQSTSSSVPIEAYPMKSDDEIFAEAGAAYAGGAGRYCMVFSGTGPSDERVGHLTRLIGEIKRRYNIEVCVSPGVINESQAHRLKEAGLDRLNHNLNTSEPFYRHICTSHTYADRWQTLQAAKAAGLPVCSGVIVGMGEGPEDVYGMAKNLRDFGAASIPVNFLIPIPGIALKAAVGLTPEYCLRVLCLFRFLNPQADIRMAAGREMHLRSLEPLGLLAASSLFLQGYLNAKGSSNGKTLQMIKDMGFMIKSDVPLDRLLEPSDDVPEDGLKGVKELRPFK